MNLVSILVMTIAAAGVSAQAPNTIEIPTLERLCGKLQHEDSPGRGRNLGHVAARLYSAQGNGQCCEGKTADATTETSRWGGFQFKSKGLSPGLYWLEFEPNGRKYQIQIRYSPRKYSEQKCTETLWDVDDAGNLRRGVVITVD